MLLSIYPDKEVSVERVTADDLAQLVLALTLLQGFIEFVAWMTGVHQQRNRERVSLG